MVISVIGGKAIEVVPVVEPKRVIVNFTEAPGVAFQIILSPSQATIVAHALLEYAESGSL